MKKNYQKFLEIEILLILSYSLNFWKKRTPQGVRNVLKNSYL